MENRLKLVVEGEEEFKRQITEAKELVEQLNDSLRETAELLKKITQIRC